ncbi:MAG TPA: flavin reductase family protein [Actinoplanes sp.]|nr:flavin reductase family protein [Actinoplanes sp.]
MGPVNPVEPGAQIHSSDPFATPEQDRSPVRRFRGRVAAGVTLWTAPGPAGLTVSSMMVADGEPGRVLGLIDEESDFWDAVSRSRRFAVTPLSEGDQQLADRFAGLMPSPGGPFALGAWTATEFGPVPADAGIWAGCELVADRPAGWSRLLEATIAAVRPGRDHRPLLHYRGRYRPLG